MFDLDDFDDTTLVEDSVIENPDLSPAARFMYVLLAQCCQTHGAVCWPTNSWLGEQLRVPCGDRHQIGRRAGGRRARQTRSAAAAWHFPWLYAPGAARAHGRVQYGTQREDVLAVGARSRSDQYVALTAALPIFLLDRAMPVDDLIPRRTAAGRSNGLYQSQLLQSVEGVAGGSPLAVHHVGGAGNAERADRLGHMGVVHQADIGCNLVSAALRMLDRAVLYDRELIVVVDRGGRLLHRLLWRYWHGLAGKSR